MKNFIIFYFYLFGLLCYFTLNLRYKGNENNYQLMMYYRKILFAVGLVFVVNYCCAKFVSQKKYQEGVFSLLQSDGDTVLPTMTLPVVNVVYKKKSNAWYKRYFRRQSRLEYNVRKVYPYSIVAADIIFKIEEQIKNVDSDKEKKQIIKREYSRLMKVFKEPLMKLTITQGGILMRLIHRETQNSSFAHIKEYKGTINAYFWQSLALLFGNNLKSEYNPEGDDYEIEQIVQKILSE